MKKKNYADMFNQAMRQTRLEMLLEKDCFVCAREACCLTPITMADDTWDEFLAKRAPAERNRCNNTTQTVVIGLCERCYKIACSSEEFRNEVVHKLLTSETIAID